ncbi:helix-turn-helix domain-containing protein [uncultured Alsobacter sp.]|uniref:helix-turn-helix domain-containing protein n=1 Tax=uncultured Alsobacter sp. TaxID=1748258 RepID=UPI0025D6BF42|nr:helix-turn-helix domain-containing protein [uncultured Alsobacter sp.]
MPQPSDLRQKAENVASRLRQARKSAGYETAAAAARALGIRISTYAAHENTQNGIPAASAAHYASAFGCDAAWLIGLAAEEALPEAAPTALIPLLNTLVVEIRRLNSLLAGAL